MKKRFLIYFSFLVIIFCEENSSNQTKPSNEPFPTENSSNLDVFQKEIEILENTIDLYQKKIEVLKKIRESYIENKKPIMVS